MGYTTDFNGVFKLNKTLEPKMKDYLIKFNETRRMKRDLSHYVNKHTGQLIYGVEGEFYVDGDGPRGQGRESNIIDYNKPPSTQPGLWCGWRPTENGDAIMWDGVEKFYNYREWIVYIIQNFLAPCGYILNGTMDWQGEDSDDFGQLVIKDNVLFVRYGHKALGTEELFKTKMYRDQVDFILENVLEIEMLAKDVTNSFKPKMLGTRNE